DDLLFLGLGKGPAREAVVADLGAKETSFARLAQRAGLCMVDRAKPHQARLGLLAIGLQRLVRLAPDVQKLDVSILLGARPGAVQTRVLIGLGDVRQRMLRVDAG